MYEDAAPASPASPSASSRRSVPNPPAASNPDDSTVDTASAHSDDPAPDLPRVDTSNQCTDLPYPLCGNGGNPADPSLTTLDEVRRLLDLADRVVPAPPLADVDPASVRRWIDAATAALVSRREAIRLARAVERILDEHWGTTMWIDRQREVLARREAQHQAKADGRYWKEREAGRRSQQPTHVEVDPVAWKLLKAKAAAQRRTVGALVGHLVAQEVHRCTGSGNPPPLRRGNRNGQSQGRHANLFARLEVSKERWQQFRSIAAQRDITIARYVGIIVEKAVSA